MQVLIVGSGGREHALAWKLGQSKKITKIFVAPGNGGTATCAVNIPIEESHINELVVFAKEQHIDLVIPGPELPLTLGIVDVMQSAGIPCFGPSKWCAQLEGSKSFAKKVMDQAGVPTAYYGVFQHIEEAKSFVQKHGTPIVVKADGLAAGKGVIIAHTEDEAFIALEQIMQQEVFGLSGKTVILEEFLEGEEVSLLAFCSGEIALPLPSVQDHKAAFDNDKGPNTGGMGAYSPTLLLPDKDIEHMADNVIRPVLKEMSRQGHPYTGILYAGLMITKDGPKVLEYNTRFGDPESQPLVMRVENDFVTLIEACLTGTLDHIKLQVRPDSALGVVIVAEGYPGAYPKGMSIQGIEEASRLLDTSIFQSGTYLENNQLYARGGRILCVTSCGKTLLEAQMQAYRAVEKISIEQSRYRTDIGSKGLR